MATFDNSSLLNWKSDSYKVTVDSSYKVYFALVRPSDYRCAARSTLYSSGEYDVTTIMEALGASFDTTVYTCFALVVVDADYQEAGAQGSVVTPGNIAAHVTIEKM